MAKATSIAAEVSRNHPLSNLNQLENAQESPLYQRDSSDREALNCALSAASS
jgi:hypothetical protein